MFGKRKNKKLNVLVLGSDGMLGNDVYDVFKRMSETRYSRISMVCGMDRARLDEIMVTQKFGLVTYLQNSIKYDVCVNCIAMTDTKAAETTNEGHAMSFTLNALTPKYIAEACAAAGVHLIHISTDYVFSEKSTVTHMFLDDVDEISGMTEKDNVFDSIPFPCNVYGMHKLLGEEFVKNAYAEVGSRKWSVLRTSWLYGMHNSKSFVHKLLKNALKAVKAGKNELEMTENEVSVPTSTMFLCNCIVKAALNDLYGVRHAIPTEGTMSRTEWSKRVLDMFFGTDDFGPMFSNKIDVIGVKRENMLQPEFSAMKTSLEFEEFGTAANDISSFLGHNREKLVAWVLSEN